MNMSSKPFFSLLKSKKELTCILAETRLRIKRQTEASTTNIKNQKLAKNREMLLKYFTLSFSKPDLCYLSLDVNECNLFQKNFIGSSIPEKYCKNQLHFACLSLHYPDIYHKMHIKKT